MHSSQRMLNWQYAMTFSAAIYAAVAAGMQFNIQELVQTAAMVGIASTFVFWNLDRRTRALVHASERALKEIEAELDTERQGALTIFANTERKAFWQLSYTQAFLVLFVSNACALTLLGFGDELIKLALSWSS